MHAKPATISHQSKNIFQSLITPCEIIRNEPGLLVLRDTGKQLEMAIGYDPQKLSLESETINLNDEKISSVWGGPLRRILLRPQTATTNDTWTLRFHIVR